MSPSFLLPKSDGGTPLNAMSLQLSSAFDAGMLNGAQSLFISNANWLVDYEGKEACKTDLRAIVGPVQTFEFQTEHGLEKRHGREVLFLRKDLTPESPDNADHTFEGLDVLGLQANVKIGDQRWAVVSVSAKTREIVRVDVERSLHLEISKPRYRTTA